MPAKKKADSVIAVCIQEPQEDGSKMDMGIIKGDELRFLHQAFITDSLSHAYETEDTDIRLYYIDLPERKRLVDIVLKYLSDRLCGGKKTQFKKRVSDVKLKRDRWGIRIDRIFRDCFGAGYDNVLVLGSRTPTVTSRMMNTALKMLKESDAVFGPTPEGRYYTIGMSRSYRINLADYDWKSPKIYSEVAEAFTDKGMGWSELEIWYTVENPDDLEFLARDINQFRFEGDENSARETELVLQRILAKLEQ
jgi:glycosyltransferase A (GT-A) superfamily protein (DUF2064 family)